MDTNMSCMSYACYVKLKDPSSLKIVLAMSIHPATGHDLYPIEIICCKITIQNTWQN